MAHMSYCRWENTAGDFEDCYRSLMDEDRHAVMFDAYRHDGGEEWAAKMELIKFLIAIFSSPSGGVSEWEEELSEMEEYAEENKEE
jgi:hypothetical protein